MHRHLSPRGRLARLRRVVEPKQAVRAAARSLALRTTPPIRRLVERQRNTEAELQAANRQIARLRRRVARLQKDHARLGELVCDESGLEYAFIVTYGRSGSTLLQGILSATPSVLMRGENNDALYQLFRFRQLVDARRTVQLRVARRRQERSAWFGIEGYDERIALRQMRQLMLQTLIRPEPDSRIVGFKEVRYDKEDLVDYVRFIREVFPDARIIVNTRDHGAVSKSKWWGEQEDALENLAMFEARLMDVLDDLGDAAYHVHYDDYVADPNKLRGLFEWLGVEFDERRVKDVLAVRHSF